jgi:hypothetical protein
MAEIIVKIPGELKELESASGIRWQLAVEKKIREELEEIARIERIVSRSKMTQEQADSLADEVNESLSKRYAKILKG